MNQNIAMEPVRVVDGKLIFALRVPPGVLVAELPGTITEAVTDTDRLRSQVQKPFGVTTPFVIEHNCAPSAVVVYSFLALKGSVTVRLLVIAARQCEVGEFVTENQRPDLTVLPEPFRTLRRKALGLSPCSCCPENVPTFPSKFTSHPTVWRGPRFPDYEHAFVIERAVGIVERALNKVVHFSTLNKCVQSHGGVGACPQGRRQPQACGLGRKAPASWRQALTSPDRVY